MASENTETYAFRECLLMAMPLHAADGCGADQLVWPLLRCLWTYQDLNS